MSASTVSLKPITNLILIVIVIFIFIVIVIFIVICDRHELQNINMFLRELLQQFLNFVYKTQHFLSEEGLMSISQEPKFAKKTLMEC